MSGDRLTPDGTHAMIDGTVWPVNLDEAAHRLRYSEHRDLHAAAAVSAYLHLMSPGITQATAIAMLKRGRRAARLAQEADR